MRQLWKMRQFNKMNVICSMMDNGPGFCSLFLFSVFCSPYFYQHGLRADRAEQGNEKSHLSPVAFMCWLLVSKAAVFSLHWPVGSVHGTASTQGGWIA